MKNVTTFIAIYGAVLSTWSVISGHIYKRPKIKVALNHGIKTGEPGIHIVVGIANAGYADVQVRSVSLMIHSRTPSVREYFEHLFKYRRISWRLGCVYVIAPEIGLGDLPKIVEPFSREDVWFREDVLREYRPNVKEIRFAICVQDGLGKNHYSNYLMVSAYTR